MDPVNGVNLSSRMLDLNNISFSNAEQQIILNGTLSDNLDEEITFTLNNFKLSNLNTILNLKDN